MRIYTASNEEIARRLESLARQMEVYKKNRSERKFEVYLRLAGIVRDLPASLSKNYSSNRSLPPELSELDLEAEYWVQRSIETPDIAIEWAQENLRRQQINISGRSSQVYKNFGRIKKSDKPGS